MDSLKVYIIILNFRQWEDARDCLESVLASGNGNYTVFVVDNNSGNKSLEQLSTWLKGKAHDHVLLNKKDRNFSIGNVGNRKIVLVQNDENRGFAAGNNVVLELIRNENAYFWLLNPDMIIRDDTLQNLVICASNLTRKSIVGSVVRSYSGNHELLFYGGHKVNFNSATVTMIKDPALENQLDYISGASLFSHCSNLQELGLLPEGYFLYWEETDWCYRAKRVGYVLAVCPEAICYDKISTIIGKSFLSDYYYARNGLRFVAKYGKTNSASVVFFMIIRFVKRLLTGQWARARGVLKGTIDYFKYKAE